MHPASAHPSVAMQQTLLALCAVAIFSIYALNSTRDEAAMDRRSVTSEMEKAAEAVARARLAEIERRSAFDEQDVGRVGGVRLAPPTSPIGPDTTEATADLFDDLDDYHGFVDVRTADAVGGPGLVSFDVSVRVRYVAPSGGTLQPSSVPTLAKEVTVRAVESDSANVRGRPVGRATLSTVFTPAGMTSFRR